MVLFLKIFFAFSFVIFAESEESINLLYKNNKSQILKSREPSNHFPDQKKTTYSRFAEINSKNPKIVSINYKKSGIDYSEKVLYLENESIEFKIFGKSNYEIHYEILEGEEPEIFLDDKVLKEKFVVSKDDSILKFRSKKKSILRNVYLTNRDKKVELPDVLFIVIDSLRADVNGFLGGKFGVTPNLDEFAKKSFNFLHHSVNSSWTRPSTLIFFTGKYASKVYINFWDYPVFQNERDNFYEKILPLPALLSQNSYSTSMIGNNPFLTDHRYIGVDVGFETVNDFSFLEDDTEYITKTFKSYYTKKKKEDKRPQFFFLNYNDPHKPYTPRSEFLNRVKNKSGLVENKINYLGEVAFVDEELGKVFQLLKDAKTFDKTMIIITSDHGEVMQQSHAVSKFNGVYTLFGHGQGLYEEDIHTPLLIKLPNQKFEKKISNKVRSIDIFPTILDILGISNVPSDGLTLKPLWEDKEEEERIYYGESRGVKAVRKNGFKLQKKTYEFHREGPAWEGAMGGEPNYLFDLKNDPDEISSILNNQVETELAQFFNLGEQKKNQIKITLSAGEKKTNFKILARSRIGKILSFSDTMKEGFIQELNFQMNPSEKKEVIFQNYPDISLPLIDVFINGTKMDKGSYGVGSKDIFPGSCKLEIESCKALFILDKNSIQYNSKKPRVSIGFLPANSRFLKEKVILEKEAIDILKKQGYVK
ncbi:MAG: sulfatase [Leptospiraceae bacterium]|nr:sulfatase [Leptospiraceae bacterium]